MRSFRYWSLEIGLVAFTAVFLFLLGAVFDLEFWFLGIFSGCYLAWHFSQIYRLKYWLTQSKNLYPPDSIGIWNDIFHNIFLLQKKNRKQRKKLTQILQEYRASTSALPDGAVVLGAINEIVWFNKSAAKLLGLNPKQDIGQRIVNLIRHPRFIEYLKLNHYDRAMELASPIDNKVKLSLRIATYNQDQKLLIARDITRIHLLEKVRQDFVANVSHELRTPVTVVNGYLELMSDQKEQLPSFFSLPITKMQQQIARMQTLVDDLLLLAKLETDEHRQVEKVDIKRTLLKVINEAQTVSSGKHHLVAELIDGVYVLGVERELYSAFSNIVINAIKYTPRESKITVSMLRTKDKVKISFKDNGPGIESHHIDRLTERFYRVDEGRNSERGGTGLGLSIVKHVLDRHDSVLQIESKVGEGSEFYCWLLIED